MPDNASVSSTGGLGTNFEQRVQAAFLIGLLTGGPVPCIPSGRLVRLSFQTRKLGYATDDLLAEVQSLTGQSHRLVMQIKNNITLSADDKLFEKVLGEFWQDYHAGGQFNPARDRLVLVKSGLNDSERNHLRVALNWAQTMATSTEFFLELRRTQEKKKRVEVFRRVLQRVTQTTVSDEDLWQFLRCVELLDYDYMFPSSVDEAALLHLLRLAKSEQATVSEVDLWREAQSEASRLNTTGGSIQLADLVDTDFYRRFAVERLHPVLQAVQRLASNGRAVTAPVRNTINGIHLPREASKAAVLEALHSHAVVLVSGEAGVGKSAVVRDVLAEYFSTVPVFAFRADQFNVAHLNQVFTGQGVNEGLADILAALALLPEKILFVDSAEKLLEAEVEGAFQQLLALQPTGAHCQLVLTARQYAVESLAYRYPLATAGRVPVPHLTDAELVQLSEGNPALAAVLQNVHLRELLRSLKYLELASTLLRKAPGEDLSSVSLPEFKQRVWQHVVEDVTHRGAGLPQKRSQAFGAVALQRARQMALYTDAPTDADEQALEALVHDGLLLQEEDTWRFAPTHDVLEDLALTRFIRDQWRNSGRPAPFFHAIGHEPALRRGFRLWLTDLLAEERTSAEALNLVGQVMADASLALYWRDELLVAILRSAHAGTFFQRFESELLRDSAQLLHRVAHLLRTACRQNAATKLQPGAALQPVGSGWSEFLAFSARHRQGLTNWQFLVMQVLVDWSPAIGPAGNPLPVGALPAKELVFAMLAEVEREEEIWQYDLTRSFLPELLRVGFELTELAQSEVEELLQRALASRTTSAAQGNWRLREFYKKVLQSSVSGGHISRLCLCLPELIVEIANRLWRSSLQPRARAADEGGYQSMLELEAEFGLVPHQRGTSPAGVLKTPVRPLLTHRAEVGLPFVVDFVNYCTAAYAQYLARYRGQHEQLEEITFSLPDGTAFTQLGDYTLWAAYRGTSTVPNLLTSVLMGVEQYLLESAGLGTAARTEQVQSAFRYVLRHATSVALSGALVSVALAYPEEVGAEWLPLLAVPQFFDWDFTRALHERMALSPIDYEIATAQRLRHESNRLPHRTRYGLGLVSFVPRYQFLGLHTAPVHAALDRHKQALTDQSPVLWRKRLNEMDMRDWDVETVDEENQSVLLAPVYDAQVQEAQAAQQPYFNAQSERLALATWIGNVLEDKVTEAPAFASWEQAYVAYTTPNRRPDTDNRLSGLAIIGLRYFAGQLTPEQQHWCHTTLTESIDFRLTHLHDTDVAVTFNERNSLRDYAFVWQSFELLYATASDDSARATVELLLLRTAVAAIPDYQYEAVRTHLPQEYFVRFPEQLAPAAGRLLAYAALLQDERNAENAQGASRRLHAQPRRSRGEHSEEHLRALLASPAPAWEPAAVSFSSHDPFIVMRVLLLIPFTSAAPIPVAYVQQVVQLTLTDLALPENDGRGYPFAERTEQLLGYSTREAIAQYLGAYLLHTTYEQAEAVLALLLTASESPSAGRQEDEGVRGFCKSVLTWVVTSLTGLSSADASAVAGRTAHFWRLWTYLREWATAPDHRWLAPLVLLDVPWTAESRYWLPLESGREEYLRALRQLGNTHLRAGLRVLATVGSRILLPAALPIIVELWKASDYPLLVSSTDAERVVQHLFQQHLHTIKSQQPLLEDLLWLLDELVNRGSPTAYLIREEVITFRTA